MTLCNVRCDSNVSEGKKLRSYLLSQRDESENYITSVKNLDNSEECEWEESVCSAVNVTLCYSSLDSNPNTSALRFLI